VNGRTPTAEERQWLNDSKELGCIVCITQRLVAPWETPPEYTANHHIDGARKPGAHLLSIPLCANHHQHDETARHVNKRVFVEKYGTELYLLGCARAYVAQKKGPAGVPSLP
jgi:hypothetical protein